MIKSKLKVLLGVVFLVTFICGILGCKKEEAPPPAQGTQAPGIEMPKEPTPMPTAVPTK